MKRMTGGKVTRNVPICQLNGGRKMVVSVGRVQEDITLTAEEVREMEKTLGASRRKREALMAWLRQKSRKLVATGVREQLVEMDRALKDWYEVVEMDVEQNVEVKGPAPAPDQGEVQQEQGADKEKEEEVSMDKERQGEQSVGKEKEVDSSKDRERDNTEVKNKEKEIELVHDKA